MVIAFGGCILEAYINSELDPDQEIKEKYRNGKDIILKIGTIIMWQKSDTALRLWFVECYLWSQLLQGVETWTLEAQIMKMTKPLTFGYTRGCWEFHVTQNRHRGKAEKDGLREKIVQNNRSTQDNKPWAHTAIELMRKKIGRKKIMSTKYSRMVKHECGKIFPRC